YALERGHTSYTSNLGLLKLRQGISASLDRNFGLSYDPEAQILIAVGVSEAMDLAFRAVINPGDEVLYHEPCYVSYSPSIVVNDEVYAELTVEGEHVSIASLPGMKERTIFLHGFSKAYAMTGFRIGYACGPPEIIEAMMRIHQYSMLCASIISQEAAIEAI